ncbi:MAG: hypothetical protein KTR24_03725 [Saprospiraceae bacterium]|nr:hypothetical protein [Saprospiraceae bacterium]
MNYSIRTFSYIVFFILITTQTIAQSHLERHFPLTAEHWTPLVGEVEFFEHRSAQAARGNGYFEVMLNEFEFTTGTIEYDVELVGNGFPGINFRIGPDSSDYEVFYLRHFGKPDPKRRTTMQYAAVMDGINLWDITDEYQAAATLHQGQWNHVKLVVSENQLLAYVNDMENPALRVPALEGLVKQGRIKLTGNVIYANMKIVPNKIDDLPQEAGYDPAAHDPNYLVDWEVSQPIDFPIGRDVMMGIPFNPGVAIDTVLLDSTTQWSSVHAEHRAVVNLTKLYGATDRSHRRLIWLKSTIDSERVQEKRLKLGFRDEVWVFINGQPLHIDKNYYGSPGMKDPIGRCSLANTSFDVPLQEGENELLIGVANYFFGWGVMARFEDNSGLSY